MKIATIGVGMVGSQVASWFKDGLTYDIDSNKKTNTWEEAKEADVFFICVPTPYKDNDEYDLSYLQGTIDKIPDGKTIVIKSTVNPGTTDYFVQKYPKKIFLFNPEFLTELSAKEDFIHPDMQIIGVPHPHYEVASKIMLMLPPAPTMRIVSPIDAEWVKKVRNSFYAVKVMFFNEIYDILNKTEADYETIRSIVVQDPRVGNSHSFIFHKNYRGFGNLQTSACIPKDLFSLLDFAKIHGVDAILLNAAREQNKRYLEMQDLSEGISKESS